MIFLNNDIPHLSYKHWYDKHLNVKYGSRESSKRLFNRKERKDFTQRAQ